MDIPSVEIGRCVVRGRQVEHGAVSEFLGLRYAEPPTGPCRFAAPERVGLDGVIEGVIDATAFGPAAPQFPGMGTVPGDVTPDAMDEDCLFLNVWAPSVPGPHPVFVWFYGGAFLGGFTADPTINGGRLAARAPMVVVTVGYRVGALGWLDLGATNCGLRDQQCALEWVRDHIGAFGGDAGRVTIAGESAGGGSVLHLLASPGTAGLFRGAIVQSGATDYTRTRAETGRVTEMFVDALDGADPRAVPWRQIIEAQGRAMVPLMTEMARMPFHPCVDGEVLHARPVDALRAGVGAEVALVIGTTRDEMRLFLAEPQLAEEQMCKRVDRYLGRDGTPVIDAYRAIVGDDPMDIWAAIQSDREMLLPAVAVADAHQGATFRYLFTWEVAPRADRLPLRSCHAADLAFTFGTLDQLEWETWTGADRDAAGAVALVDALQNAWCRFAATADPGWPNHQSGQVQVFGRESGVTADPSAPRLAVWR